MKLKKIVLTGAAGRLGSYLREPLTKMADELVSTDIVDDIGKLYTGETYHKADLASLDQMEAVIEGAGDHCCEYMTGGHVTILGNVGLNFAAGMTGGFAYVLDENRTFFDKCNRGLVGLERITTEEMQPHRKHLKEILNGFLHCKAIPS